MTGTTPPHAPLTLPKAIIFDWDKTLTDNYEAIYQAMLLTLDAFGHEPWDRESFGLKSQKSTRETFPETFGDRSDDAIAYFYKAFEQEHIKHLTVLDGAEDVLNAVGHLHLALVSNKRGDLLRKEVPRYPDRRR